MATSDFEEDEIYQDDDNDSLIDDVRDIKDKAGDLKDKYKDYKNNSAKEFNKQQQSRNIARTASDANSAGVTTGGTGTIAGSGVSSASGAAATGEAAAGGTAAGGAAAGGAAAGGAAAGGTAAATGAAAAGVSATGVGAIVVAVVALLAAIKKLQDKIDKKAADNGLNTKAIRRLIIASPILAVFAIIMLILVILMLISNITTASKADTLRDAIACAESIGCTDFMNTGISISSASVPLGSIGTTIASFSGSALNAAEQATNNKYLSTLNTMFEGATSKDLIYFTDLQIARLVIEYLMFENKYYGFTETINELTNLTAVNANGAAGDEKSVIDWLFNMLVEHTIIGDVYEAYSLFNWLKLEKVAFNKIQWKIIYTGISGTGMGFVDDTLNNFCTDTRLGRLTKELTDFCNESKETESLTFKVVGDLNPFTSMLWVPTSLWSAGDAAVNAADVFGITDLSMFKKWKASMLPDQETLVNAVKEYLPTWIEVFAVYVDSDDLGLANEVYNYYLDNIGSGGKFEIKVSLYALRNYAITRTLDFGDQQTYYNIYDKNGELIKYDKDGSERTTSHLTESQIQEFVGDTQTKDIETANCTDDDYKNETDGCTKGVTKYTTRNNKTVNCTDDDYKNGNHGCKLPKTTKEVEVSLWQKIKNFAKNLEEKLRKLWAGTKAVLSSGWYYASNFVKDFIYDKFPLSLASERTWTISVTKGTTFDAMYEWSYNVETEKTVEKLTDDATSGFSNQNEFNRANGHKVTNSSKAKDKKIVSTTTVSKTDDLTVKQITEYVNIEKEVTTWDEMLTMTSSKKQDYILPEKRHDKHGNELVEDKKYDNRLAYVLEIINADTSSRFSINSDDFAAAYDSIRTYKGQSYTFAGVYTDYSNLKDGAFGWPLESYSRPVLTSCTGLRGNVFGGAGTETHGGDDIAAPQDTKILAAKDGEVILNQYNAGGYGYYVILKHSDGWYTLYGHMVRQSTLGVGTNVTAGQVIGYVGTTGRSTGNHLHFEIRYGLTGGFWSAEKKEPILYVSRATIPKELYTTAGNCVDKKNWGI